MKTGQPTCISFSPGDRRSSKNVVVSQALTLMSKISERERERQTDRQTDRVGGGGGEGVGGGGSVCMCICVNVCIEACTACMPR